MFEVIEVTAVSLFQTAPLYRRMESLSTELFLDISLLLDDRDMGRYNRRIAARK